MSYDNVIQRLSSVLVYNDWMLKSVPYSQPPEAEKRRQRIKAPSAALSCRCGSQDVIEVKSGVVLRYGKPSGGTKQIFCAICFMKGDRVVLA
jgi:hypothetical protein